jgi:hypothetical protein
MRIEYLAYWFLLVAMIGLPGCGLLFPCGDTACVSAFELQVNRSDGTQVRNFRGTVADSQVICSNDDSVIEKNCRNDRVFLDGYGDKDNTSIGVDIETTGEQTKAVVDKKIAPDWRENGADGNQCPTCYRASEIVVVE